MGIVYVTSGVVAVILVFYLLVALLKPEIFQ